MSLPLKVLWSEGMTLVPQMLQQQDHYHEARLQRIAAALNPQLWGVLHVVWNQEALSSNVLTAERMALLFQDGELVDAPLSDPLPSPFDLGTLPAGVQQFVFHAALPSLKALGGNLRHAHASSAGARYAPVRSEAQDLFSTALDVEMTCLCKPVQLLSPQQSRRDQLSFPVVALRRLAHGGFEIDPGFMPPAVTIEGAGALPLLLDNLLARLGTRLEALYQRHRQPGNEVVQVHGGDLSSFWMLNTISAAAAGLTHIARHRRHHPEYLFGQLMAFAGALMAFSTRYVLGDLPAYEHDNPAPGFIRLDAIVRELVDTVIPTRCSTIALRNTSSRPSHYYAELDTITLDRDTRLCLAVNADMPALELVRVVPLRFKVADEEEVERITLAALHGIELVHMAQVPPEVPVRPNTYYFSIEPRGVQYEAVLKLNSLVIYVPMAFDGIRVELFAIAGKG